MRAFDASAIGARACALTAPWRAQSLCYPVSRPLSFLAVGAWSSACRLSARFSSLEFYFNASSSFFSRFIGDCRSSHLHPPVQMDRPKDRHLFVRLHCVCFLIRGISYSRIFSRRFWWDKEEPTDQPCSSFFRTLAYQDIGAILAFYRFSGQTDFYALSKANLRRYSSVFLQILHSTFSLSF